jgi:anthranilate synthase component II
MIVLIDNYDSFTYNLYHQIAKFGQEVIVVRNDAKSIEEIRAMNPDGIVISPGPGTPSEAGITIALIQQLYKEVPILGICLGHQAIGEAFGANIIRANIIMHGKTSELNYINQGLFKQMSGPVQVMRYHSLIIEPVTLSDDFLIVARSKDDHEIMAIQHRNYPLFGLQFHPESIGTEVGEKMVEQFLSYVRKEVVI